MDGLADELFYVKLAPVTYYPNELLSISVSALQMTGRKGFCTVCEGLVGHNEYFVFPSQIVPYFGLLFTCFEMCKQVCLYRNGYIVSPLSYKLKPGVDQSLGPYELQEVKRYLRNRRFQNSSMGNRW